MAHTYDITQLSDPKNKVRLLIGDVDMTDAQLEDEEINALIQTFPDDTLYMVAGACCESIAAKLTQQFTQVSLSSLSINDKDRVAAMHEAAKRFFDLDQNEPAFAVAEEDLSDFNALQIIRNYIFRTEADGSGA